MLGKIAYSALPVTLTRNLGEFYLGQARTEKEKGHLDAALALYDQVKETLKSLRSVKESLRKAQDPQTLADETLRTMMAAAYFERGEVLDRLNLPDKARSSYLKAEKWGHDEAKQHRVEALQPSSSGYSAHSNKSASAQTATPTSMSVEEKSELVDYLFEKALLTLSSLEVSKKPSFFLVYAHDNEAHGEAKASTSKYLIEELSKIQVVLYSDQTPMAQPYAGLPQKRKQDGRVEDILTSQVCLLPDQLQDGVEPVDKVVVCCSEVLGRYLTWPHYEDFYQALQAAYLKDREAYCKDGGRLGNSVIREVLSTFSEKEPYKAGFHHVLTEMAFLQIRAEQLKDQHGIIPVSLTPNSYKQCLGHFIERTRVRLEDITRLAEQAQTDAEVYPNQSRHWVLFKLIERLLINSDEAQIFLKKFWQGYRDFISQLNDKSAMPGELELTKSIDGIFDGIRTALHNQLVFTVQQQHQQLRVLHADPRDTLKAQYFDTLKQDQAFEKTRELYVQPRGKAGLDETEAETEIFPLLSKVQALLTIKQVVLLRGDSGAGKTTFNRILEKQLWEHKKEPDAIPLFISLASIDKPEHDLIAKALKKRGLSEFQIQTLRKEKQSFVFILDGYDEIQQTQNLYLSNHINQPDGWQGQMVISCRSEYLGQDYRSRFQPNPNRPGEAPSFQEIVIEPFSAAERNQYLENYVQHNPTGWPVQQYQKALLEQAHLQVLVNNPFLLRVALDALPYLDNEGEARSAIQLRLDLYDQFIRHWFERNEQRLSTQDLNRTKREILRDLCDEGFAEHGIQFVQSLAVHLYTENAGNPVVEYSSLKDKGNWKEAFFGRANEQQLLREAWPLTRNGNQYRFIHKSLLEYLVVRALFESFDACIVSGTRPRRDSDASIYSFEDEPAPPKKTGRGVLLDPKHWVSDLGVVHWLTDRVRHAPSFKQQLLAIIERSKTDTGVRQAAANAITILVKAGVPFNQADLKGIQIPGADLSFGLFDSAQLQGADLRKINFRASWLREANFNGAQMAGVRFGEWPYLQAESSVTSCAYSPNGEMCAVGLGNGAISVYTTSTWGKILTLRGHTDGVNSVVYSPSGTQLASGSHDKKVRLWDAQTGAPMRTLAGHIGGVLSVVYSPSGEQIASGSTDRTVRLWDAQTGKPKRIIRGHTDTVWSVVYSPSGWQIASGSRDNTVRLWDAQTGKLGRILRGHTADVFSVVYSPSGAQIASGSNDTIVRLWDAQTAEPGRTLGGHTNGALSVAYSPSGQQIASGKGEGTVQLWDAQTGEPGRALAGHTDEIFSVVYSPSGAQIASGSKDTTVRLWDAQTVEPRRTLAGHTDEVWNVVYSPSGAQIVSGSRDTTVRLWDAQSGEPGAILRGHIHGVMSVMYSPSGAQIASGSADHTVRLWDAQTGESERILRGHTDTVWSVVYSPNGAQIASGSLDATVRLWDAQIGKLGHTLAGHTDEVLSVVYAPSGAQIASGSRDTTVRLWDAQTGKSGPILRGHTKDVWCVVYSPNGAQIASGSADKTLRLWNTQTGKPECTLRGHTDTVWIVVYSLSGAQIASGSVDRTVRLWDAQTGESGPILQGHTNEIWSVVYSPNGAQIASGSVDNTVRLWDPQTGQCQMIIQECGPVNQLAWKKTDDGCHYLVVGSKDKSVRQWEIKKEGENYKAVFCWSSTHSFLTVRGASIEGVGGLNQINKKLLKQRGALGEPSSNWHEASQSEANQHQLEALLATREE